MIRYIHFETLDSTITWARTHASTLDPDPITCITASEQTAGRGRFSRKWISPVGNIYASYFLTLPSSCSYLANLGQILTYSCAIALKEKGFETKIKWPNDLLIQKRKVAGVSSETFPLGARTGAIVSIGLNVNMSKEFLRLIDQPATSLAEVSKRSWDLQEILLLLSEQFVLNLEKLQKGGFAPFQVPFEQLLAYKGEMISCLNGTQALQGLCQGITREGYLELLLPSGEKKLIATGEVTSVKQAEKAE